MARRVLEEIEGGEVVVVAHGGLLHYLTEDWRGSGDGHGEWIFRLSSFSLIPLFASQFLGGILVDHVANNGPLTGTGWKNGEVRTYVFDRSSAAAIERAAIQETKESIALRFSGEKYVPLTAQEQYDLRVGTERAWARDGYIELSEEESP